MPAHTKITYEVLLPLVRRLWSERGQAPSANAVSKAAGGGAITRIHHVITAVGIERGVNVGLYSTLPEELRALIAEPEGPAGGGSDAEGSPELAEAVRAAMAQLRSACAATERRACERADQRVTEAEARMTADLDAMDRRLREAAADADAAAQAHAEAVADYERRLTELSTGLAAAREAVAGRVREHEHLTQELEVARARERGAQTAREQALAQQQSAAERFTADLTTATERALRAEAERDTARQLSERLAADLDRVRSDADAALARMTAEVAGLRAELTAAQHALSDAERARAVADALLAASRGDGQGTVAAT